MENSKPFPLFNLPWVALQEVLKTLNPFELINFSMMNSKTKMKIKSFLKPNKYLKKHSIQLYIRPNPILVIGTLYAFEFEKVGTEKENLTDRRFRVKTTQIFCENVLEGVKNQTEYTLDLFSCEIDTLLIDLRAFPGQNDSIINWITSVSETVESLTIIDLKTDDKTVHFLLNKLKITKDLNLDIEMSDTFQSEIPTLSLQLFIRNGNWISLNQLLSINSPSIQIRKIKLSNNDLNVFINHWMQSSAHLYLRYFEVPLEVFNVEEIFQGLQYEVVDQGTVRYLYTIIIEEVRGGIDVRRVADGATATFLLKTILGRQFLLMIVH